VVGYLSRLCPAQGLDVLVEAWLRLRREPDLAGTRLAVTGGQTGDDLAFVAGIRRRLQAAGVLGDVRFQDALDRESRQAFLRGLTVLSVPVPGGEAFGLFQLEAMAAGVPVVQPRAGAFPEVVAATGGGVVYEPLDAGGLAAALAGLLRDPARLRDLGRRGQAAVHAEFTVDLAAARNARLYRALAAGDR
jgi:glycosyltransferase involved in cell wall biosynthesis